MMTMTTNGPMPRAARIAPWQVVAMLLVFAAPAAFAQVDADSAPASDQAAADQRTAPNLTSDWEPPVAIFNGFGVDVTIEASLVRFLSRGIPESLRTGGTLPPEPAQRIRLFPMAMEAASRLGYSTSVAPLMRILDGDLASPIERLIEQDSLSLPTTNRADFVRDARRVLRFGAANALSLLGEEASLPLIERAYRDESSESARLKYALAEASLGDTKHLGDVVQMTASQNRGTAYLALEVFADITGQPMTVTAVSPVAELRRASQAALAWYNGPGRRFVPDPREVIERRIIPAPSRPQPTRAVSLRDHLILAMTFDDVGGALGRESRRYLGELPAQLRGRLVAIARDEREDVDIRAQAIFWHVHNAERAAVPLLRDLRTDENPEIRVLVEDYLTRY